ncbi:PleD family two-component system response regulator [Paracoccus sp. p3-h83]|uniref:response regulator n=1 Tax=Paracoccus sp. p3-h83 TaxID=3342805 RepID=UPI0035B9197C
MRILAVDDDEIILQVLEAILQSTGDFDFTAATGGPQALALIENAQTPFDCILLDIQMPDMDGIELCRRIRTLADYAETPILMVTAMSDRQYIDRAFQAGANDYITKPFEMKELLARIRLVHALVLQRRELLAQSQRIDQLSDDLDARGGVDLETVMSVGEVGGMIDFPWFQNYVMQLSRSDVFGSGVLVVGIENIAAVQARASRREFRDIIADVAECISDAMDGHWFVFSYAGDGIFCLVTDARAFRDRLAHVERIREAIAAFDIRYVDTSPVNLHLDLGRSFRVSLISNRRTLDAIDAAIDDMRDRQRFAQSTPEPTPHP